MKFGKRTNSRGKRGGDEWVGLREKEKSSFRLMKEEFYSEMNPSQPFCERKFEGLTHKRKASEG